MALDATKVKVAGSGAIWKAPAGTSLPSDSTTAWAGAFVNLGYINDGGFELDQSLKTKEVGAWQTLEIVRLINTSISRSVSFDALESNKNTVALAWGGATVTPGTGSAYTMTMPDASVTQEFILGIDWTDGSTSQRIIIKRAALKSLPKVKFTRQDAITYSLEIQALAPADGSAAIVVYGSDAGMIA
jgi:hypothetical protein